MSKRNILFIVNPTANSNRAYSYKSKIERYMNSRYFNEADYRVVSTKNQGDATKLAKFAEDMYDTVVAVGGDGTIKEVVSGIVETKNIKMGIIPAGTGNDFVAGLNLEVELERAIDRIINNKTKSCDVGMVNGEYFINIATVGFDALVVNESEKIKTKFKTKMAYKLAICKAWLKYHNLSIQSTNHISKRLLIAVGIGKQYGGGFPILPLADYSDGKFDICSVGKLNRLQILYFLPSLISGKHIYNKNHVKYGRSKELKIEILDDCFLNLDGEIRKIEGGSYLDFKICERQIEIIY